jgi:hypothetical protein
MNIKKQLTDNCWKDYNDPNEIVMHHWDDPAKHPTLDGVVSWFLNPASQVSAHYVVSGDTIIQMVEEKDAAWHAVTANNHSIGIEVDPNTPGNTLQTVGELVANIRSRRGDLPLVKHKDVPGTSTTCPGDLDVGKIDQYAKGGVDMKVDLSMVQQMAQTVGGRVGRNGFSDTNGSDLKSHIGTDAGAEFLNWYWSKEGIQWRDHTLPDILNAWQKYKDLGPQLEADNAKLRQANIDLQAKITGDSKILDDLGAVLIKIRDRLFGKK